MCVVCKCVLSEPKRGSGCCCMREGGVRGQAQRKGCGSPHAWGSRSRQDSPTALRAAVSTESRAGGGGTEKAGARAPPASQGQPRRQHTRNNHQPAGQPTDLQRNALGAEPEAVVHQLGVPRHEVVLQCSTQAVQRPLRGPRCCRAVELARHLGSPFHRSPISLLASAALQVAGRLASERQHGAALLAPSPSPPPPLLVFSVTARLRVFSCCRVLCCWAAHPPPAGNAQPQRC